MWPRCNGSKMERNVPLIFNLIFALIWNTFVNQKSFFNMSNETSQMSPASRESGKYPLNCFQITSLIARFMGSTWGPPEASRTQVGPMLATRTLLSRIAIYHFSTLRWHMKSRQNHSLWKHVDVIKWKHFPRNWPFVRGIPHTKASDAELWCFLWSAPE